VALIHVDSTGILAWHFEVPNCAGDCVITLGIQTDNNDVDQIALKGFARAATTIVPLLSNRAHLVKTTVVMQLGANKESGEQFSTGPVAGTATPQLMVSNVAVLIRKKTSLAGRKHRGRFFMPGAGNDINDAANDQDAMTSAKLATWQTAFTAFYDGLKDSSDGDPLHAVILHPPPDNTVTAIDSFDVQARLATQRGRLRD
jgi:hypothetical protein